MKTIDEERYIFRCIAQRNLEPIASFVNRLRKQLAKCGYEESEHNQRLKEQIIEKCADEKLRKIAFQVGMNVESLVSTGTILEAGGDGESSKSSTQRECTRCGFKDHEAFDPKCPAKKGKGCESCRKPGHYARMCFRNKTTKRSENFDEKIARKRFSPDPSAQKESRENGNSPFKSGKAFEVSKDIREIGEKIADTAERKNVDKAKIEIKVVDITPTDFQHKTIESVPAQVYFAIEQS